MMQILLLALLAVPLSSEASKTKGRISLSDYFSFDSEDSDLHVLSGKVRIYRPEDEAPGWFFNVNARVRGKILDGSFHEDSPEYKIRELWVGYKFPDGKLKASIGRQYIEEMYNSYVDGLNLKYFIRKDIGIGIFGGLSPDKYDSSFNSKFQTIGIYTDIRKERYNLKVGYENLKYKGETDREYLSMKLDARLRDDLKLNAVTVVSENQITDNIDLENVNMNLLYSYSKDLRFTLFYNYYRAVKLYSSAKDYFNIDYYDDYFYEFNSLARTGLKVNYRILRDLKIFGSIAYQRRGVDDAEAVRYTGGLNRTDLYGFDLSGRYTHVDNFDSIEDEFRVEVNRRLFDRVDASVYVSHELEQLDSGGGFTNDTLTYGSSFYWKLNKSYDLFIFIERYQEDDYYNTSIFTKLGYKF
jgi:hypothetical protein